MRLLLAALVAVLPSTGAMAQSDPVNPFEITCAQLLSPADENQRVAANMMEMWAVGYMYGRFGPDAVLTPESYDEVVSDMVGLLQAICPNRPDMPIAEFAENIGNDLERSLEQ